MNPKRLPPVLRNDHRSETDEQSVNRPVEKIDVRLQS